MGEPVSFGNLLSLWTDLVEEFPCRRRKDGASDGACYFRWRLTRDPEEARLERLRHRKRGMIPASTVRLKGEPR